MMIEDINVFCAIAKHQSFSKAARELEISTPVITRRLVRLEQQLETRLLNRTTRQVTLTEAGSLFYSEVSDILQALEASKESMKSLTTQVSGTLKIGIPVSLSQCYVVPALKEFLKQYPKLKLQIVNGSHLLNLLHNGFDLVIQCGELPPSSYYYKKIVTMKKVLCAAPDYLKKHGYPNSLEALSSHNCLYLCENIHKTWAIRDKGKIKEIQISGNVQVDNPSELKRLAVDGLGITYLAAYFIQNELKSGKLVSILDQYQPPDYSLYAVYPTKKFLAKKNTGIFRFHHSLVGGSRSEW